MLQHQDDYICGVYEMMKATSFSFGTNELPHDFVRPTWFMIFYAILGCLFCKEEADEDGTYPLRYFSRISSYVLTVLKTDMIDDELCACVRVSELATIHTCFCFWNLLPFSTSLVCIACYVMLICVFRYYSLQIAFSYKLTCAICSTYTYLMVIEALDGRFMLACRCSSSHKNSSCQ